MSTRKNLILIPIAIVFILFFLFLTIFFLSKGNLSPTGFPTPTSAPNPTITIKIIQKEIPQSLISVSKNNEITSNSQIAVDSAKELEKISSSLPFIKQQTLSTGVSVKIVVSKIIANQPKWILSVFIGGIDYQIPENHQLYELNKKSFLEATSILFDFLKSQNVDVKKIFINWGDRAFIQERAEKWLSENK